jgi:uncharacterized protein (TIGR02186 family)
MRALLLCIAIALGLLVPPAAAQQIVADLSQSRVSIDARFEGSEIVVFGAVKPGPGGFPASAAPLEVIIAVSGPLRPVTVRKKDSVAGIWVNTEAVEISAAPTLYKVASTGPLADILFETEDLRHSISIPRAIRAVGVSEQVEDLNSFTEALMRIRSAEGHYEVQEGAVTLHEQTLFSAHIALPANLVEGAYLARIYLTRDRAVVAQFARTIDVRKVRLERWIYTLAHSQPLVYVILSLSIAIFAGWGASTLFRYIRS